MLVRANALGRHEAHDTSRVMAACPDTDERGDPWRWSVSVDNSGSAPVARVDVDPDFIDTAQYTFTGVGTEMLGRKSGEVLVATVLRGEATITSVGGPWQRALRPDDVFVLEGEEFEQVTTELTDPESLVSVFILTPKGRQALRWVP